MKKIVILCLLVILMAPLGFSQVFVGGSGTASYTTHAGLNAPDHSFVVRVNPIFGYRLGIFGAGVSLEYQQTLFRDWRPMWRAGVFGELRFFSIGNFSVLGRADFFYTVDGWTPWDWEGFRRLQFRGQGILEYALTDRLSAFSSLGSFWYTPALLDTGIHTFSFVLLPSVSLGFKFFF